MTKRALGWLAGSIAALPMAVAQGQAPSGAQERALFDPTRPPGAAAGMPGAAEDAPVGTQLQSVLISSTRRLAIINGNTVAVGGMVGEARVVRISETEVILKNGDETEVLKMYPGIEKRPVKRAAARRGGSK